MFKFTLPDPGEGLVEAEIVRWLVHAGDEVKVNDVLVEIETAKSLVELPSPVSGVVSEVFVAEGAQVNVGEPIIAIDDGSESNDEPQNATLVGSGPKETSGKGRRRKARKPAAKNPIASAAESVVGAIAEVTGLGTEKDDATDGEATKNPVTPTGKPLAKPLVRRLARALGIDLSTIVPTGPHGSISQEDVQNAAGLISTDPAQPTNQAAGQAASGAARSASTELVSTRQAASAVRRMTARHVVESVQNHVHVTEFNTIDVTKTMDLVDSLKKRREFGDEHVSPLLIFAKAALMALQRNPDLNASWDRQREEIVYHPGVNLGIAASTPRGLLVPVIHDAHAMNLLELCQAINQMVIKAREGRLQPTDYARGTFTITNVGVFGIDTGTPIINGDESAILAMGAIKRKPWVVGTGEDEKIVPRWVTTLAVSFDHQIIDGEQGSSFLRDLSTILEAPEYGLLF